MRDWSSCSTGSVGTSLLKDGDGRISGATGFDMDGGERSLIRARAVILVAGGYTSVYRRGSSRKDENTGDAVALAYDAGAALRDMEFTQFHLTGFSGYGEIDGKLVTEAGRDEGGKLFNCEGDRFMQNYSPEKLELNARDVVARANYREIQEGRGTDDGSVLLDVTHLDEDYIKERIPSMYEAFGELGVDITQEPMKVTPTAHYAMGGIKVDFDDMTTTLGGLYAVGESTSRVHGANHLDGNSLAEALVFGKILDDRLAQDLEEGLPSADLDEEAIREHFRELDEISGEEGEHDPEDLITELRGLIWEHGGIVRTADNIREGSKKLKDLEERARRLDVGDGAIEDRKLE